MAATQPEARNGGATTAGAEQPSGGEKSQDADLSARIEAAKRALEPEPGPSVADKYNSLTLAWRMTLELVVGSAMGFGIGWGLDALFGTAPFLMMIFGLLGFAAGIKLVYETAQAASRPKEPSDGSASHTPGAQAARSGPRTDEDEGGGGI